MYFYVKKNKIMISKLRCISKYSFKINSFKNVENFYDI